MHKESRRRMGRHIGKYLRPQDRLIADLGSMDFNGSYRELIEEPRTYVGIDIAAGKNVDLVMLSEYIVPVQDNHFDSLITGQCFEHVRNPFKLMSEVGRIVRPGGTVLCVAPHNMAEHRFPLDCWRYLSDGWQALFDESGIEMIYHEYISAASGECNGTFDSWAIGRVK